MREDSLRLWEKRDQSSQNCSILALTSASLQVSAEAFDGSPCRSERIIVTAMVTILGGGVGGAFSEGGLLIASAVVEAGLIAGMESVEIRC